MEELRFDGERVESAFRDVFYGSLDGTLTDPSGLAAAIAVELANAMAPDSVSESATAALLGMLVGTRLSEPGDRVPESLPAAVETVRVLGRARVIATHCDLDAVARVEQTFAAGLGPRSRWARDGVIRLFEVGLAIGLAARYA